MKTRRQAFCELLHDDFLFFVRKVFETVSPHDDFSDNWHLSAIAYELREIEVGRNQRLIINIPPRSLKSIMVSIAWVAWRLGHEPTLRVACVSYSSELAGKLARDCRLVMQSAWFQAAFPNCRLSRTRSAEHDFETTAGGGRFSTSTGGPFTGRGADLLIIDDPMKAADVWSEVMRKGQMDWLTGTALSRVNQPGRGAFVVLQQRLHQDDLSGRLIETGDWRLLRLPAIAQADETIPLLGGRVHHREVGEALHAGRESLLDLARRRREMGDPNYAAQIQQDPTPAEGAIIKRAWLRYYDWDEAAGPFSMKLISWDTACKTGEEHDNSAATVWGVRDNLIYLLEVVRGRFEFQDLEKAAIALAKRHPGATILIEEQSSGVQLLQVLKFNKIAGVIPYRPQSRQDKAVRLHAQASLFMDGTVRLPLLAPFMDDYERELLGFPGVRHDDQVDSTSQALAYLRQVLIEDEVPNVDMSQAMMWRRNPWKIGDD